MVRGLMGEGAISTAHNIEEAVKGVLVPGVFFEELGFRYIGPIDGHNLEELVPIMAKASELEGPILLHVVTKKGKGLSYAERDPITYHAANANMKIETGEMAKSTAPPAFTKIFGKTLWTWRRRIPASWRSRRRCPAARGPISLPMRIPRAFSTWALRRNAP